MPVGCLRTLCWDCVCAMERDKSRLDRTGQERRRDDRAGQNKGGEEMTGQYRTGHTLYLTISLKAKPEHLT